MGLMCLDSELCDMQIGKVFFPSKRNCYAFRNALRSFPKSLNTVLKYTGAFNKIAFHMCPSQAVCPVLTSTANKMEKLHFLLKIIFGVSWGDLQTIMQYAYLRGEAKGIFE